MVLSLLFWIVMVGLDPTISETSYLVLRFSGLRFASPENDGLSITHPRRS
jgi:hypothetical protein